MGVLATLKFCARMLGFNIEDDKLRAHAFVFLSIQLILLVNIAYFISDKWRNVDDRFNGLKAIIFMSNYTGYTVSFLCCWTDFSPVSRMFYQMNFKFPFEISSRRRDLLDSLQQDMKRFDSYWRTIIAAYVTPFNALPALILIVRVFLFSETFQKLMKGNQSSPFPLYFPECIARFQRVDLEICVYVVGYVLHCMYMIYVGLYAQLAHVTSLTAMANLEFELKLLRLSLLEMERVVSNRVFQSADHGLRSFVTYFVRHHQDVYRRFEVVNRGIRWVAASLSTTVSLYMCMSIYTIVQKDQVVLKGQEAIYFCVWAFAIYLFDSCGEKVQTEDEKLRNAMYECDWLEKPEWFKRSLLMSMTRASKPIAVKPFGIFKLNLNSFALTINAAYSYYSLLHNIKSK